MIADMEPNPYESPRAVAEPNGRTRPHYGVYKASIWPRDVTDWAIGLLLVLFGAVLTASVAMICLLLAFDPLYGTVLFLLALCPISLLGIRSVSILESGLEVKRFMGPSLFLTWEATRSIRPASRREVVRAGLLLPHRSCTVSMSFRDQYRIDWDGGCFIFSPRQRELFVDAIRVHLGQRESDGPTQPAR